MDQEVITYDVQISDVFISMKKDLYIIKLTKMEKVPWLEKKTVEEWYLTDGDFGNVKKRIYPDPDHILMIDDGGTEIIQFKNGKKLIIPHKNEFYGCEEILRYGKTPLEEITDRDEKETIKERLFSQLETNF